MANFIGDNTNNTLGVTGGTAGTDAFIGLGGNDTLVYDVTLAGGLDVYQGNSGIDTMELRLTAAQWASPITQARVNQFKALVDAASLNGTQQVNSVIGSPFSLALGKTLSVASVEKVRVYVDNVLILGDPPASTTGTVQEDGVQPFNHVPPFAPFNGPDIATGVMPDTDNAGQPIPPGSTWIVGSTPVGASNYGTMVINPTTGQWTFDLNDSLPAVQDLQTGQTITFTYTMVATDPTTSNALPRNVTITIQGRNDAATVAVSGTDFSASERGGLNNSVAGPFGDGASGSMVVTNVDGLPPGAPAGSFVINGPSIQVVGTYGTLTFTPETGVQSPGDDTTAGTWTYSVNQLAPAVEALKPTDIVTDTIQLPSALFDGATQPFVFTVHGADDLATIKIVDTVNDLPDLLDYDGAVREAGEVQNTEAGDPNANGQFVISDPDTAGPYTFAALTSTPLTLAGARDPLNLSSIGVYGNFSLNTTTGQWTYVLDNTKPATEALTEGQVVTETLVVRSSDSPLVTNSITVTIIGNDDYTKKIVSTAGTQGSDVADPGDPAVPVPLQPVPFSDNNANGTLTITDPDGYPGAPVPYNFPLTALGSVPFFSGGGFDSSTVQGAYGQFVLTTPSIPGTGGLGPSPAYNTANWTYALNAGTPTKNSNTLRKGESDTEVMYVSSTDGGVVGFGIEVTVKGTNDAPVMLWNAIDGAPVLPVPVPNPPPSPLNVVEAGGLGNAVNPDPSVSGVVTNTDIDNTESGWHVSNPASQAGTYGTFTFNSTTGAWSYSLNQVAADPLMALEQKLETFKLKTNDIDDISQSITITITGSNDTATITENGVQDKAVKEAGGINNGVLNDPNAGGDLDVVDIDGLGGFNESFFRPVAADLGAASQDDLRGTYGNFTFNPNTGAWGYTLTNFVTADPNSTAQSNTLQALNEGETATDTLIVYSLDNSASQAITVTVTGSNDFSPIVTNGAQDRDVAAEGVIRNFAGTAPLVRNGTTVPFVDYQGGGDLNTLNGENFVPAVFVGTYGTFSINAAGNWGYVLDNEDPDTLALLSAVTSGNVALPSAQDFFTVSTTTSLANPSAATYTIPVNVFGAYTQVDLKGNSLDLVTPNVGPAASAGATPVVNSNGTITYIARNGDPGETLKVYLGDPVPPTADFQWGTVSVVDSATGSVQSVVNLPSSPATQLPGPVQGTLFVWDGDLMLPALNLNLGVTQGTEISDTLLMNTANANGGLAAGYTGNDRITGTNGADHIDGGEDNDTLNGGDGNDTLLGGEGDDVLRGGNNNDRISGGTGEDDLFGGAGNDALAGGFGRDTLEGNTGVDTFVFQLPAPPFGEDDEVTDFVSGTDKLWFVESLLTTTGYSPPGAPFDLTDYDTNTLWLQSGPTSVPALPEARFIYDNVTGQLLYDADGAGAGGAVLIATLTNLPAALLPTDFQFGNTPPAP